MKSKKTFIIISLLLILATFIFIYIFLSLDKKDEKTTIMLDYTPNTNHTGIYVALDKGYYKEKGINLEIITNSSSSVEQAVANQKVDFGISYEENITIANDKGITGLKSIYAILSQNTSGFISYKEKGIKSPKDLNNKTYCGWGSEVEEKIVQEVAEIGGAQNVNIVSTSTDFLRSNKNDCDFFWEFEGWSVQEANNKKIEYNYMPLKDYGIDFYTPIIITSNNLINENSELVQNFVSATIKGYEYAHKNPKEAGNIFLKYNSTYDENLIYDSQKYVSKYYIAQNKKAGYQYNDVWENFTNFLYDSNIVKTKEYKELYTNEFINKYYESKNKK